MHSLFTLLHFIFSLISLYCDFDCTTEFGCLWHDELPCFLLMIYTHHKTHSALIILRFNKVNVVPQCSQPSRPQ